MTPLDILRGARELLAKPEAWTKEFFAANASGDHVLIGDESATCFCLRGAMMRIGGGQPCEAATRVIEQLEGM